MKTPILVLLILSTPLLFASNDNKSSEQSNTDSLKGIIILATVGADVACDFTTIQAAIDAGRTELHIASNKTYFENIMIDDIGLSIRGGYEDCSAGSQTGRSIISGITGANAPTISITGDSQRNMIILHSLIITTGSGSGFFAGGGITSFLSDSQINIFDSNIKNNTGALGGGISVLLGSSDVSMHETIIENNTAQTGGGIYCGGNQNSIKLQNNSGIYANNANGTTGSVGGQGGGAFIDDECNFTITSGTSSTNASDKRGISNNQATTKGGGLAGHNGASLVLQGHKICNGVGYCTGDDINPINLNDNVADSDSSGDGGGGGAFIAGASTRLNIKAGRVTGNFIGLSIAGVAGNGGAFSVNDGADLNISRPNNHCWNQNHCNLIAGNTTGTAGGLGGAIYNNGSYVIIENATIRQNRADMGTVVYGINNSGDTNINGRTILKGSIIHANGDNGGGDFSDSYVFRLYIDSAIELTHSTVADNNAVNSVFGISPSPLAAYSTIYSSIIHDNSSGDVMNPGASLTTYYFQGSILHETNSLDIADQSLVADPVFVDRNSWNFHIDANSSPAVDFNHDVRHASDVYKDMDFQEFGYDDFSIANEHGYFDAGADETYTNDIIFKDSFE